MQILSVLIVVGLMVFTIFQIKGLVLAVKEKRFKSSVPVKEDNEIKKTK